MVGQIWVYHVCSNGQWHHCECHPHVRHAHGAERRDQLELVGQQRLHQHIRCNGSTILDTVSRLAYRISSEVTTKLTLILCVVRTLVSDGRYGE